MEVAIANRPNQRYQKIEGSQNPSEANSHGVSQDHHSIEVKAHEDRTKEETNQVIFSEFSSRRIEVPQSSGFNLISQKGSSVQAYNIKMEQKTPKFDLNEQIKLINSNSENENLGLTQSANFSEGPGISSGNIRQMAFNQNEKQSEEDPEMNDSSTIQNINIEVMHQF